MIPCGGIPLLCVSCRFLSLPQGVAFSFMNYEKQFKGVWIPVEIWEAEGLSWMEKCLWAEISSLGTEDKPCYASNAYLAEMFNSSEASIANMISKLRSLNMIKNIAYDGRHRKIVAIIPSQTSPTNEVRLNPQVKSDLTHRLTIDTSRDSSKESIDHFDTFWNAYPKKVAKEQARKAWIKSKPDLSVIIPLLDKFKASKQWQDKQYIPNPDTFIRNKRWEDEVVTPSTSNQPIVRSIVVGKVPVWQQIKDSGEAEQARDWLMENIPDLPSYELRAVEERHLIEYKNRPQSIEF